MILFIVIIIVIISIELYLRYYNKPCIKKSIPSNETSDIWKKIVVDGNINKYYIKINNLDEDKFVDWKKNIGNIDYDVTNKLIVIKTETEAFALASINLFIVYLNGDIDLDYIIENDLINRSKTKASTYKMVKIKLIELIKEGLDKLNNVKQPPKSGYDTYDEKVIEEIKEIKEPFKQELKTDEKKLNNSKNSDILSIPLKIESSPYLPYGGSEYAIISF
jgi:hypothetical protein